LSLFRPDGAVAPRALWPRRLVAVSRLVERKGLDSAVEALASLPFTELVVAGGPASSELGSHTEACRLRRLSERLGVAERLDLRGRVDHASLPALLRSADAVVCVPWYEPFGMVPLEAMACGTPVVASAVGGMVDTVLDGRTGCHVPPKDPEAIAGAVRWLLDTPGRRDVLVAAGIRRTRARYSWERVASSTLDTYSRLVRRELTAGRMGER
ncbi:MAG: glycosyltransferase family 1 protein, partial [Acidimicrobiales bacterium]|nr:glycosyltransferase family 1 protein [Acidimicrobiales bacterium]